MTTFDVGAAVAYNLVLRAQMRVLIDPQGHDGRLGPASVRALRGAVGVQSRAVGLQQDGITFPETQVQKNILGRYPDRFVSTHLGAFYVSGGFMEAHGHSQKGTTHAIFTDAPATIRTLAPSDRNLGVDYVVTARGKEVRAWYGGLVLAAGLDGGYGLRVTVETDVAFTIAGEEYTVYQAYGHNEALHVRRGEFIEPRHVLATMGGTGQSGAVRYGEHVDLRTWIDVGPRRVDLSPNALDRQLPAPAGPPVRRTFPQVATAMLALSLAGTAVLAWRIHARKELR